ERYIRVDRVRAMLETKSARERRRGSCADAQPCSQCLRVERATKHFADPRARRVAPERDAEAFPVLRAFDLDDWAAESRVLIVDVARDSAESVRRKLEDRGDGVPPYHVVATRDAANAIAANARIDRRDPVARQERAPRTELLHRTAVH